MTRPQRIILRLEGGGVSGNVTHDPEMNRWIGYLNEADMVGFFPDRAGALQFVLNAMDRATEKLAG